MDNVKKCECGGTLLSMRTLDTPKGSAPHTCTKCKRIFDLAPKALPKREWVLESQDINKYRLLCIVGDTPVTAGPACEADSAPAAKEQLRKVLLEWLSALDKPVVRVMQKVVTIPV